ncbi:MAG: V-type ATP synthase subunit E [Spirochaetaceae bacterium]|jgi:V/A-type H+-transporting ATPase subunit E|nr:V-type ATP synthase subunit E [Spirochaetaceae bacterium]
MDIQLQELIEKIKKDGIESAGEEGSRIKTAAEAEAKRIVDAAKKQADDIIARARVDAERDQKAGVAAIEQAARNLLLSLKLDIEGIFSKLVSKEISKTYNNEILKLVIPEVVKGWVSNKGPVDVILSETELESLRGWSTSALAAEISKGVEFKAGKNMGRGFRVGEKDGSAYYDFSAEALAGALSDYVNPQIANILQDAAQGTR